MHVHRIVTAAACLSLSVPVGPGPDAFAARNPAPARITIESASAAWTRRVEWGLDRFRASGLALPPMAISVHGDMADCNGESGVYRPRDPVEVHLCSPSPTGSRAARLITLHELAHAWAETQLTIEERAAFLRLRGLEVWVDPRRPAHEWGAEHAAEVVSWGLMDELVPIVRIYDAAPTDLSMAFALLVGRLPLWSGNIGGA